MDTIFGCATAYPAAVFERFLVTLRNTGFVGDVMLLVTPHVTSDVRSVCDAYGAALVPCPESAWHIQTYRYVEYRRLLSPLVSDEARVMLTDVRDVVFQADPFTPELLEEHDLLFFKEDKAIGECRYNQGWLRHAFGNEIVTALRANPILCSGVLFGSVLAVLQYCEQLVTIADQLVKGGTPLVIGIDQGIHNYLYYHLKWERDRIRVCANEDGPVLTMGYAQKRLDYEGRAVDRNNRAVPVVHQFDRMNVADLERLSQRLGFPLDDLLANRPRLQPGMRVFMALSAIRHTGAVVDYYTDARPLYVALGDRTLPEPLEQRLLDSYAGDEVSARAPCEAAQYRQEVPFPGEVLYYTARVLKVV